MCNSYEIKSMYPRFKDNTGKEWATWGLYACGVFVGAYAGPGALDSLAIVLASMRNEPVPANVSTFLAPYFVRRAA